MINKNSQQKSEQKNYRKTKITLLVLAILLIAATIAGSFSIKPAIGAYYSAMAGKKNIEAAQQYITNQNFSAASLALREAENNFKEAEEDFAKLSWLRVIPYASRQQKAGKHLLATGSLLTNSLVSVTDAVVEIMEPINKEGASVDSISAEEKRMMLQNLYRSTPALQTALSKINLAELEMEEMPDKLVTKKISEANQVIAGNLPQLKEGIEGAIIASRFLPSLAGYPEEENYLFLFQNNGELRPGGGFLGSYGIIKVKDGELTQMVTDDTYNLDKESPVKVDGPWQIPTLLSPGIPSWYFRDSNWSPDFPTNAEKAQWFYDQEGGTEKDFGGVVAITPTFIEYLMELTGDIKVSEHPKTFTSSNVTDLIQHHVEQRFVDIGLPESYRKNIIGELANVMVDRLFSLPRDQWDDLFKVLGKAVDEKHFLLYFNDNEIEKYVQQQKWGGEVQTITDSEDYFMVVDANLASRKTDFYMERTWDYNVDFSEDTPKVQLNLHYHNTAPGISWKYTRYRTWTRVYAPEGSQLTQVTGSEKGKQYYNGLENNYEINNELGKTAFGTFFVVEPGAKKTVTFEYTLPGKTQDYLENGYNLSVQKQAGTLKPELNITAQFSDKYTPVDAEGEGTAKIDSNKIEIDSDLLVDREYKISF